MIRTQLKTSLLIAVSALACSCAWGYAGEDGKVVVEDQPEANAQVVEFEGSAEPKDKPVVQTSNEPTETEPDSPCGVDVFTLERYTPEGRVIKAVDCVQRKAVSVKREPMSHAQLEQARAAGLPEGSWYLLVDPKGLRAKYLSNAELIKISKQFEVEYLRKDRQRNLLIYEFRDAVR